jgi:hypothetical protein
MKEYIKKQSGILKFQAVFMMSGILPTITILSEIISYELKYSLGLQIIMFCKYI